MAFHDSLNSDSWALERPHRLLTLPLLSHQDIRFNFLTVFDTNTCQVSTDGDAFTMAFHDSLDCMGPII